MDVLDAQQFLVSCTASLIEQHGVVEQEGTKGIVQEIVMVRLSNYMLKNVVHFECCQSLRICILANNFITNIAGLSECVHLVKLDLSGNQITQLPDVGFWKRFVELQLLNLHDNNMSTRQHVMGLSGCSNLAALTLHNTPLSLRENYRHCMVNSLWSLKALDKYIISDEEIIEGFTILHKFKQMTPHLAIDLHPSSKMEPFKSEMKLVMKTISKINQIQAHYSPTLIIQKWFRGHLTRKSLGITSSTWHWRKIKKQLSPIVSEATITDDPLYSDKKPTTVGKHTDDQYEGDVKMKLLMNLLTGTAEVVREEQALSSTIKLKACTPPPPQNSKVLSTSKEKDVTDLSEELQSLALEMTGIHLYGYKAVLHQTDPVTIMHLSRQQDGKDVRRDLGLLHSLKPSPKKPPHPHPPMVTAEQRLTDRCHAGINLEVFNIVERANRARARDEVHRKRAEHVTQAQARREEAREYRDMVMEGRRKEVLQQREQEQVELQDALLRLKANQNREAQEARERHALWLETRKLKQLEQAKTGDFCCRHLSLCKVIVKQQDRQRRKVIMEERQSLVTSTQAHVAKQKQLIQKYLERRKQSIKESTMISRMTLNSYKLKVHNNLLRAAKVRVARKKSSHAKTAARKTLVLERTTLRNTYIVNTTVKKDNR
ncbi:leucine-rich repeat and IQ domain-containing protein 3 isoform X1 [Alosa sapidissima]|uniref:leucine-rich repeat and IQ domain-containing protein 3 isoform X1 n=1 Tax=Alosa sapidissima TaxID=34773 RepID=UPI001C090D99|nr:leucine-rich repeat and IQ domain-containing protein 3 isoform X1 [Alosa sapidissima]XP_041967553.1 leucine-rich repeat and IQ domain-containing protein 3 isoform X1 [Alosa sapidissima]XP_041967554.1 leucine-rich repeat and IQ domain-containing protein 3 isoform X1 [Alosa sapidissima]